MHLYESTIHEQIYRSSTIHVYVCNVWLVTVLSSTLHVARHVVRYKFYLALSILYIHIDTVHMHTVHVLPHIVQRKWSESLDKIMREIQVGENWFLDSFRCSFRLPLPPLDCHPPRVAICRPWIQSICKYIREWRIMIDGQMSSEWGQSNRTKWTCLQTKKEIHARIRTWWPNEFQHGEMQR